MPRDEFRSFGEAELTPSPDVVLPLPGSEYVSTVPVPDPPEPPAPPTVEDLSNLEARVSELEAELTRLNETNELLRRILAEVTKQRIIVSETANERITDEDVKEVWQ